MSIKSYFSDFFQHKEDEEEKTFLYYLFTYVLPIIIAFAAILILSSGALHEYCGATNYFNEYLTTIGLKSSFCSFAGVIITCSNLFGMLVYLIASYLLKPILWALSKILPSTPRLDRYLHTIRFTPRQREFSWIIICFVVSCIYIFQGSRALIESSSYTSPSTITLFGFQFTPLQPFVWLYAIFVGWWKANFTSGGLEFTMAAGAGSAGGVASFLILNFIIIPAVIFVANTLYHYYFHANKPPELLPQEDVDARRVPKRYYIKTFCYYVLPKLVGVIAALTVSGYAFTEYCGNTNYFKEYFTTVGLNESFCSFAGTILLASNGFGMVMFFVSRYLYGRIVKFVLEQFEENERLNNFFYKVAPSERQQNISVLIGAALALFIFVDQGGSALVDNGIYQTTAWPPLVWLHAFIKGWWAMDYTGGSLEFASAAIAGSAGGIATFLIIGIILLPTLCILYNMISNYINGVDYTSDIIETSAAGDPSRSSLSWVVSCFGLTSQSEPHQKASEKEKEKEEEETSAQRHRKPADKVASPAPITLNPEPSKRSSIPCYR